MFFHGKYHHKIYLFLFSIILIFSFTIIFFLPQKEPSFRELTNQLFLDDITTDTLSLHYTLAYPSHYSIDAYPLTLPKYADETLSQSKSKIENCLFTLKNMDVSSLSSEESYCYHLLKDYFSLQIKGFPFTYLEEYFSPSSGIVANYPVLMAEYAFRTEKDVTDYLSLLTDTSHYFSGFFEFQKQRAEKGYHLASDSLQNIVEQCNTIITKDSLDHNSHFLQITFRERLAPLVAKNIISKEKAFQYIEKNNSLLKTHVLPAYEELKLRFLSLQTQNQPLQGLYKKQLGKEYYQWMVQKQVGSALPIPEMLKMLQADYEKNLREFCILQEKIASFTNYNELIQSPFPLMDRKKILTALQEFSKTDFPSLSGFSNQPVKTTIKSVTDSMEKYTSPAFYLIPPMDDIWQNTIYINNSSTPQGLDLFTTLAHEGYPGHLYQTVFYRLYSKKNNIPHIRHIMNYGGYVEGWALYCEFFSYDYATKLYPKELQDFYSLWHKLLLYDKKLQLAILSILDINLHYYNDSLETAKNILNQYGIVNEETIKDIYQYVLEEPGNYLKYYVGYLLLTDIKEKAETLMGSAFTDYKFHQFILESGPSDFENLEKHLKNLYSSSSSIDSK